MPDKEIGIDEFIANLSAELKEFKSYYLQALKTETGDTSPFHPLCSKISFDGWLDQLMLWEEEKKIEKPNE
jgi:hypothetical protein